MGEAVALCWTEADERLFDDADRVLPPGHVPAQLEGITTDAH